MNAAGGVKSLMARAQRVAQKRGQRASTAHLLLVMLQGGGDVASMLKDQGVRETDLLLTLRDLDPEALNTLDLAVERSRQLAERLGHRGTTPWHLLLAITQNARSAGHRSLARIGTRPARVQEEVLSHLGRRSIGGENPDRVARRPVLRAGRAPSVPQPIAPRRTVGPSRPKITAHKPPREMSKAKARPSARRGRKGARALAKTAHPIIIDPLTQQAIVEGAQTSPTGTLDPEQFPLLCKIGHDLTARAREGAIDPVIGRQAEIDALLDILGRRRANNPMLVGPPGVGKTAIVEGLARHLIGVEGPLSEKVIIEISAGALTSGTGVRGALSKRIAELRAEVAKAEGKVLLFIDEIHAIVGQESGGADDLAHELKAGLARGELSCIGATTDREYKRHIERDPALVRRFSPVHVGQPSPADAIKILNGIAPHYAEHHKVRIEDEAIESAVALSVRFMPDRLLPDKAIGVLDLAGARVARRGGMIVDRESIASVISQRTNIPIDRLMVRDGERLLRLEKTLSDHVVGHGDAVCRIADSLRKSAAGFRGKRPLGTFLFLGPTGVGKTEMAKAINKVFFPGTPMGRFDMSEFSEKHAVARLFGAPPGYIGHDDGGQLTNTLRRRPYQLVLLDEIEKAHPEVLLSLLPLLDEGRLTDSKGQVVDATNAIIVMTSNLGAAASERRSIGFGESETGRGGRALDAVRRAMPPELFNRIDEPLFFHPLGPDEVRVIALRLLDKVADAMREQGIELGWHANITDALIQAGGYDPSLGARPMKRVIGREVESLLASALLSGEIGSGDRVRLVGKGDKVLLER